MLAQKQIKLAHKQVKLAQTQLLPSQKYFELLPHTNQRYSQSDKAVVVQTHYWQIHVDVNFKFPIKW